MLGLIAGAIGVVFTRILYAIEDACDWAWAKTRGPEWARPAVGGLLLGLVLLVLPQMYGVGYPVLGHSIAGEYAVVFLIVLLIGKMIATSLTIGIGGSGGVFAPSLFIGAMLGSAYGQILHHLMPGMAGSAGAYGLIGMGAVFAGAARAPITAVVIMFELTGEYTIILPLMTAIVLATGLSHLLTGDTIYTLKLRRRGVDLTQSAEALAMAAITVEHVMEPVNGLLRDTDTLADAINPLSRAPHGQLPITDTHGRYRGIATARAVADALAGGTPDDQAIATLVELPDAVRAEDKLEHALDTLENARGALPVLDADRANLVGWLTHQRVLTAIRRPEQHLTDPDSNTRPGTP